MARYISDAELSSRENVDTMSGTASLVSSSSMFSVSECDEACEDDG